MGVHSFSHIHLATDTSSRAFKWSKYYVGTVQFIAMGEVYESYNYTLGVVDRINLYKITHDIGTDTISIDWATEELWGGGSTEPNVESAVYVDHGTTYVAYTQYNYLNYYSIYTSTGLLVSSWRLSNSYYFGGLHQFVKTSIGKH